MVVEVVGARPCGQASCAGGSTRRTSASRPSALSRLGGDGDQRNAVALGVGDDRGELGGLARPRDRQHDVAVLHHAEVAVAGFGGVHEGRRPAGRGERRGDLARDMAGLAHAGDDDPPRRLPPSSRPPPRRRRRGPAGPPEASAASTDDRPCRAASKVRSAEAVGGFDAPFMPALTTASPALHPRLRGAADSPGRARGEPG